MTNTVINNSSFYSKNTIRMNKPVSPRKKKYGDVSPRQYKQKWIEKAKAQKDVSDYIT